MREGLLFDTSVWIDFFQGTKAEEVNLLTLYLQEDLPVYSCPVIIQEVLQGIKSDLQFKKVKDSFLALPVLIEDPVEAAIGAAEIYRKLRNKGITIRKSNDCLIAWYALKNSIKVIHRDRDFDLIFKNIKQTDI
ncbi:MAG TPA: PIN domain nuclease [Mariniphaga anaerophila]|uniref:Ribonuclease VapC n=1 Tax=Mariniphaga anaerophila TaxID=1484053 RepID=A0A831LWW4_9BACT|nr:PIN domain nuclease [Mariniphaga anaerophila]